MKKFVKRGMLAAVVVAAGLAAYQSYGSYGLQDSCLLMQNVEALAQSPEPDEEYKGDPNGDNGGTVTNHFWDTTYTGEKQGLKNNNGQTYYVYKDICRDRAGATDDCIPPQMRINMNRIAN